MPFGFVPYVGSLRFAITPYESVPSASAYFFDDNDGYAFAYEQHALDGMSLYKRTTSASIAAEFGKGSGRVHPARVFVPMTSRTCATTLSAEGF